MYSINIHEVGAEAIDQIMPIMTEAFDPLYREAWTAPQCLSMLSLPDVWISIAYLDEQPAGFALNRTIVGEAELLLLAVMPSCRRMGVGRALISRTIDQARDRNAHELHLEVRHNNPAFDLYINTGFRLVGRRPAYYQTLDGQSHDAVTLSCSIDQI